MSDSESRRGRFTPLKRLSDDDLAVETQRGNDKAFGLLFERLQDPLYRYCMSILGNPEEARDALQNAMLKGYRALKGETREIAVRPWLYRIARNESISALRGRRPLGELEEAVGVAAAGADVDAASRERLSELVSDLRTLPERQRSALVLRELSGLDYEELGSALDISPNAARQTVFKARVAMQANVEGRTAHCDEVRAAMSKSDGRFRRRRSIQAHLERCPVCTEFASGLESRPRDLAALFPPLPVGVAAAVLAGATGGAAATGAAVGAASGGAGGAAGAAASEGGAAAAASTPSAAPSPSGGDRRRRLALVPLLLFLLLVGGAVATAVILENGEDGSEQTSEVAQDDGGDTDVSGVLEPDSGAAGSESESGSGSGEKQPGSGEKESGSGSGDGGSDGNGSGSRDSNSESDSGGSETPGRPDCVRRERAATSPAQEGYSGRGGRIEVEVTEDCTPTRRAAECVGGSGSGNGSGSGSGSGEGSGSGNGSGNGNGSGSGSGNDSGNGNGSDSGDGDGSGSGGDCQRTTRDGLPITGLEIGLILGCALLLLGLGVGLRRLTTSA
jgi:RNA polymerase sigma factor (sigma-70 family)